MQKTQNYNLNQWEPTDPIRRADFNSDNAKLDAALAANAKALSDYQTANDAVVAKKAEQSALESTNTALAALQQSMNTEFAAVAANLGAAGKNARIVWGSYTGDATYGEDNPTTLTFDFYPVIVFIGCDSTAGNAANPTVLMRGRSRARPDSSSFGTAVQELTWTDTSVSWYNEDGSSEQNNYKNTYYYVAIGYDQTA